MNPHSNYIDKRLKQRMAFWKKKGQYDTYIYNTRKGIINDFSHNLFTNETRTFFTKTYIRDHPCPDCGQKATERCHGIGEERPKLIERALQKWTPNAENKVCVNLRELLCAYFEEHKTTSFAFKCSECHKNEKVAEKETNTYFRGVGEIV